MSTTRPPDSQQISEAAFLASQHTAHLPPIDLSRIEHGVGPVEMAGGGAAPGSAGELQRELFGRPSFEEG